MPFVQSRGILSNNTDPSYDADCIVTAMILGLSREYVGRKREIIFSVDSTFVPDPSSQRSHMEQLDEHYLSLGKSLSSLQATVDKINNALKTLGISNLPKVKVSTVREWHEQEYITGRSHGAGLPFSMLRKNQQIVTSARELVSSMQEDHTCAFGYVGRGAYTGVHALAEDDIRYIGSTFRHYINPEERDRWIPDGVDGTWGLIGESETLDGMHNTPPEQQNSRLVGYTHGMIQAVYSAAYDGFKGDTIEVAVGTKTTKLASCFACTTFMCASDRPPDAIHLGRGESWAPIYGGQTPSCDVLHDRRQVPTERNKLNQAVNYANKKWYKKCASWLYWGTSIDIKRVRKNHQKSWRLLTEFARQNKGTVGPSANMFLNALTVHAKDSERVDRTLK